MMKDWLIDKGFDVYDAAGDKIGTVKELFGTSYFRTDTGFLGLGKDFYVPFSAIRELRGRDIYLNTSKDHFNSMGWDKKPSGGISGVSGSDRGL